MKVLIIFSIFLFGKAWAQLSSCQNKPCKNGGTCIDQPNSLYGFSCLCPTNYYGTDCRLSKSNQNKPIVGGTEGSVNVFPNFDPNSNKPNSGAGSININPNGGGGVSIKGNDINIGGGGSGSFGGGYNLDNCLNGGYRPSKGLPCVCRTGFTGSRCEYDSGFNFNQNSYTNCVAYPCLNGGRCMQRSTGYICECRPSYYGNRCEYTSRRGYNYRMTGFFGSLVPMLLFCCLISLCLYCCCAKKRFVGSASFMGRDIFGGRQPNGPFMAPPPPGPTVYYPQPGPGRYPMGGGVYHMQTQQQTVPLMTQDPDQVFKVNMSPPPYEEVVQKTNR